MKSFLGNFYRHLATFSGHTVALPSAFVSDDWSRRGSRNAKKDKKDHFKTAGDEYHKYHVFLDSLSALIQDYEVKFKEIKLNTPLSPNNSLVAVS